MGKCPDCGMKIGPLATIVSWDNWGRFVCPGCGKGIRFRAWLLAVVILMTLMTGAERLLHVMLISQFPLWLSFVLAFGTALLIMFLVPMIWRFDKDKKWINEVKGEIRADISR